MPFSVESGCAGGEVLAQSILTAGGQGVQHPVFDVGDGAAGVAEQAGAVRGELGRQCSSLRWAGRASEQGTVLQALQDRMHGLSGDEGAAGELGGGQARALAEQL